MVDYRLLRVGNVIEYRVVDELDEPKEQWVRNVIDVNDMIHLMNHPDDDNYRYMELTEKEVLEFGFEARKTYVFPTYAKEIKAGGMYIDWSLRPPSFKKYPFWTFPINEWKFVELKHVHELQNLFLDMVGEQLRFPMCGKIEINPLNHEQTK